MKLLPATLVAASLSLALAPVLPAWATQPTPFSARYEVLIDGKPAGEASLELVAEGQQWRHRLRAIGTKGLARLAGFTTDQYSLITWHEGRPRLLSARMRSESLLRDRDLAVDFDWTRRQLSWTGDIADDEPRSRQIEGTPATGSSLNLQLAVDVQQGRLGHVVHYVLHDRGRARPIDYRIGEAETVEVPYGRMVATPVIGERPERERVTTAWYASALPPTPVRMLQTEHGENKYELRLIGVATGDIAATP